MELEKPELLYMLILVPILVLMFVYNSYLKSKRQREFGDIEIVRKLSPDSSLFKPFLKLIVLCLAFAMLVLGIVNPKIGTKLETVKRQGVDIVFAIDISKSMDCEDIAPSRIEKSKQIVSQIINQLGGDRIGIVVYSGSAFPLLPITTDYSVAKMYLQSMNTGMVSSVGTSFDEALRISSTFFDNQKTSKLIIMISDGEDHSEGSVAATEAITKQGIKIITIGVGTEKGGPIPIRINGIIDNFKKDRNGEVVVTKLMPESLKTIAKTSKGGYVNGNNTKEAMEFIKNALDNIQKTEFNSLQMANFQSQFQWFLGFAFFFFFIDIFLLEKKTQWLRKLNLFDENKHGTK